MVMNSTRPQNLELIYEALANSGVVGLDNNGNDENTLHTIKTDIKSRDFPVVQKLEWEEHKEV